MNCIVFGLDNALMEVTGRYKARPVDSSAIAKQLVELY